MTKTVQLRNVFKAICLAAVAGYVYFLTTETAVDFFSQAFDSAAKPMVVASGLCAIAAVYIGVFHTTTRFVEGVLLLATCVVASWAACAPLNVVEPDLQGAVDGVVVGALGGLEVAILAALWSLKPGIGKGRKWLLIRCGAALVACVLIFGTVGWWRTKLTSLDAFATLLYPASFAIAFVCAWAAAAPAALTTSIGRDAR